MLILFVHIVRAAVRCVAFGAASTMSNNPASALSLRQAAQATAMSKSAILRAIQAGKISASRDSNKNWTIDASELFRVYKPVAPSTDANTSAPTHHADPELVAKLAAAEASLAALNQLLDEIKQSRDDWKQQAQQQSQLLLQHQPKQSIFKRFINFR